jgi:hypothetical protein
MKSGGVIRARPSAPNSVPPSFFVNISPPPIIPFACKQY